MRFFRFNLDTGSEYEMVRLSVDAQLGYSAPTTCIQPYAFAPVDQKGRVVLPLLDTTPGYDYLVSMCLALRDVGKAKELTQDEYDASFHPAPTGGGGGVSSWNDLTGKPFDSVGSGLSVVGNALTVPAYSRRFAWSSPYSYLGRAASGSATSAVVWTIRRTQLSAAGAIVATLTATNVAWDNYASASYS